MVFGVDVIIGMLSVSIAAVDVESHEVVVVMVCEMSAI